MPSRSRLEARKGKVRSYGAPMSSERVLTPEQREAREAERQRMLAKKPTQEQLQRAIDRDIERAKQDSPYAAQRRAERQREDSVVGQRTSVVGALRNRDRLIEEAVRDMEAGRRPGGRKQDR